jgi:hypothetical protein
MKMEKLLLIALAFPTLAVAELPAVKRDDIAIVNSSCAAFYSVVQTIVRPEVRLGYEKKFAIHLHYAKGLHESSESQPTRLQTAIKQQAEMLNEAKSEDAKRTWLRDGMLRCNTVESHTPLIVKEHKLTMDDK